MTYYKMKKDQLKKNGLIKEIRTVRAIPVIIINSREVVKGLMEPKDSPKHILCESIRSLFGCGVFMNSKNREDRVICICDNVYNEAVLTHSFGLYYAPIGEGVTVGIREEVADMYLFTQLGSKGGQVYIHSILNFQIDMNKWLGKSIEETGRLMKKFKEIFKNNPDKFYNNRFFSFDKEIDYYAEGDGVARRWKETPSWEVINGEEKRVARNRKRGADIHERFISRKDKCLGGHEVSGISERNGGKKEKGKEKEGEKAKKVFAKTKAPYREQQSE